MVLNASPYEIHKQRNREDIVGRCVKELGLPVVYVNMLGGQDELVFDGNSFVMDGARQDRDARAAVRRRPVSRSSSSA